MELPKITIPTSSDADTYIGEDGLRYCSKCRTLRETKNVISHFGKRMPCLCECQLAERDKKEREEIQAMKMAQVEKLRKASLLGGRYAKATFASSDTDNPSFNKAMERCRKYCSIADEVLKNGYGIYLYGASGVGKTHLTACMCNELLSNGKQCLFTNFLEISKAIKSTFGKSNAEAEKLIKLVSSVDFLFIDDFGTERVQKAGEDNWMQEQIFDIINKRYNTLKPTIFSSNYTLNQLVNERGLMEKTVDRVREMSTAMLMIEGQNFRKGSKPKAPF